MGRRKITIQQITDPKLRNITYNKRKNGLIKKAAEISLLCNINLMLVFEDLNGSLVQFSKSPIKNIANFPMECKYKRIVELTAEDYPDFSRIKRHKKKQDGEDGGSSVVPTPRSSKNARSFTEMESERSSVLGNEDLWNHDGDKLDYESLSMSMAESPYSMFSESDYSTYGVSQKQEGLMGDVLRKIKKPNEGIKETKAKPNLRLNIKKAEDSLKDALKAADSKGNLRLNSSQKINSSHKNYIRKAHYESVKANDKKTDLTPPPFGNYNMLNNKNNPFLTSPSKDMGNQHMGNQQNLFKNSNYGNYIPEEENTHIDFSVFPQTLFQPMNMGTTPPMIKPHNDVRVNSDDPYAQDKIVDFLTRRTSPHQPLNVFTFPQHELRNPENMMGFHSNYMNDNDYKQNSFWSHQLSGGHGNFNQGGFYMGRPNFEDMPFQEEKFTGDFHEKFNQLNL